MKLIGLLTIKAKVLIMIISKLVIKQTIHTSQIQQTGIVGTKDGTKPNYRYATLDWCGNPITTKGDGYILPRNAEMILNAKYYQSGIIGELPCDPETGEKLPIEPNMFGI